MHGRRANTLTGLTQSVHLLKKDFQLHCVNLNFELPNSARCVLSTLEEKNELFEHVEKCNLFAFRNLINPYL